MDGKKVSQKLIAELFDWAKEIMNVNKIYPYVSFVFKKDVVISRGYNCERETFDLTNQDQVSAIRQAQGSLDVGDLSGYSLLSFFEPTILAFDIALWSGISDFHWCINSSSYPASYNPIKYSVREYFKRNPNKITIEPGINEKEALKLVRVAEKNKYLC